MQSKNYYLMIFPIIFSFLLFNLISSKTIYIYPNSTIQEEIKKLGGNKNVLPGDIIEFTKGIHKASQYWTKMEGSKENHITIKGGKDVIFINGTLYEGFKYVDLVGPFEIKDTEATGIYGGNGLTFRDSENILITGLYIHNIYRNCMKITGQNITIKNNTVHDCVLNNENHVLDGWGQAIGTGPYKGSPYSPYNLSQHMLIEGNTVYNSWGEGIDLLYCEYCTARKNTVYNTFSILIYTDNARNLLIENNLVYVNTDYYNSRKTFRRAHSVGIGTESHGNINGTNITIRNNLGISTHTGVAQIGLYGYYDEVHIVHNTFYNSTSTLLFPGAKIQDGIVHNEFSNNICSASASISKTTGEKDSWVVFANLWVDETKVNYSLADTKGYEGSSVVIKKKIKDVVFNKVYDGCLKAECYLPRCLDDIGKNDTYGNVAIEKGIGTQFSGGADYFGNKRNNEKPTIGFSEVCKVANSDSGNSGNNNFKEDKSNTFVIVLIVVIVCLVAIFVGFYFYRRNKRSGDLVEKINDIN